MPINPACLRAALILSVLTVQAGHAEAPLSAIDWLSQSVSAPAGNGGGHGTGSVANQPSTPGEVAVSTNGALPDSVAVSVLGAPSPDSVGLLPPDVTGFPHDLWGLGKTAEVIAALSAVRLEGLPSLQALLLPLLLAESEAPADAGADSALLIARIDKLLEIGALEQAQALLDAAGPITSAELFRRAFDVALLTARVFCLARADDWNAAALTLQTAKALGNITEIEDALLSRFPDPDLFEGRY